MTRLGVDERVRRVAAPSAVAAAVVAVGVLLVALGPSALVPFGCPFLGLTGLDCPLCGGTRAAAALARGDLVAALDLNAFATLGLLGIAGVWVAWVVSRLRGHAFRWTPSNRFWLTVVVVGIGFAVLRNLPGPTAGLAP